jgi:glycosyltransferase involved in cell wall biosynthesis
VAVVIPALDEEQAIGGVLDALDRGLVRQVVVADNGSRDRTAEVARAHGAEVVGVPERGYGAACLGALARVAADIDVVAFMDADGADDPAELAALVAPIARGDAVLVIGSRTLGRSERGALTPPQRFGNWLATGLIRLLHGQRYTDLGPFRAVRRSTLEQIAMRDRRFGWTVEMQVRALQVGARVCERPVSYRRRVGRSKISGTLSGVVGAGVGILSTILKLTLRPGGPRRAGPSAS